MNEIKEVKRVNLTVVVDDIKKNVVGFAYKLKDNLWRIKTMFGVKNYTENDFLFKIGQYCNYKICPKW